MPIRQNKKELGGVVSRATYPVRGHSDSQRTFETCVVDKRGAASII